MARTRAVTEPSVLTDGRGANALRPSSRRAPRLVGLATAVPPHVVSQDEVRTFAAHLFSDVVGGDA
jgi:hypothetical protein